jgi:hypothetical protein
MTYSRFAFFALVVFLSVSCRADNLCPWITKATAFGALGVSEESPMASISELNATVCNFAYRDGNMTRELRITVELAEDPEQTFNSYRAQCRQSGNPLRAIGNEAVICATNKKGKGEQVFGRVRDYVFTVTIITSAENDPGMSRDVLIEKAGLVAEQVSGNLF